MNKDKLKHLPINLFIRIGSFLIPFLLISFFESVNTWLAVGISFYIYLTDAVQSSEYDYLEEKIKKLEDAQKGIKCNVNGSVN